MSEDHIGVAINGVLYVKFEDAKKLREGWDKADAEIEKLRAALRFYAGDEPWKWTSEDYGKVARAALGEKEAVG
jgi:hypothetical protein